MAYTFRRSSRAMFMTSSTTAAAFLANIFSPIMPIRSFGIYAGIIVPLNFIMTVMIFPSATIIFETYMINCCKCKACGCEEEEVVPNEDLPTDKRQSESAPASPQNMAEGGTT